MSDWTARIGGARRRVGAAIAILCATLALGAHAQSRAEPVNVTFILANDIDTIEADDTRGGFDRLAGLVALERAAGENVFYVNAGDSISPSLLSGFDQGSHIIELLNATPPDIFVPGNHEFDFGSDVFRQRMNETRFPVLGANLRDLDGHPIPGVLDTRIVDVDGVKIGFVGLISSATYMKSNLDDLVLNDIFVTLENSTEQLRKEGADIIVAVSHTDRREDMEMLRTGLVDIILSGDDHDLTVLFDGATVLMESRSQADHVALLDLTIEVKEEGGEREVTWKPYFRVVDTATVAPDPEIAERLTRYRGELSKLLDLVIGETAVELDSRRRIVRGQEAAIGNLIADALRTGTSADVAITNGGGIRGDKVYPAGTVLTRRDILTELPFGNRTVVIALTGAQLRQALENGISEIEELSGRFPQISGFSFIADPGKAPGSRVETILIGGEPIDEARTYTVATNDFMQGGGDGYDVLKDATVIVSPNDGKLMTSEVIAYFQAHGMKNSAVGDRITLR